MKIEIVWFLANNERCQWSGVGVSPVEPSLLAEVTVKIRSYLIVVKSDVEPTFLHNSTQKIQIEIPICEVIPDFLFPANYSIELLIKLW